LRQDDVYALLKLSDVPDEVVQYLRDEEIDGNKLLEMDAAGFMHMEKTIGNIGWDMRSGLASVIQCIDGGGADLEARVRRVAHTSSAVAQEFIATASTGAFDMADAEKLLTPGERIVCTIPCLGFTGFPSDDEELSKAVCGDCFMLITSKTASDEDAGASLGEGRKLPTATRILFIYSGGVRRNISVEEEQNYSRSTGISTEHRGGGSASFDVSSAQSSAFGMLHGEQQLLNVYCERMDRLRVYRESKWQLEKLLCCGYDPKCCYCPWWLRFIVLAILCLVIAIGLSIPQYLWVYAIPFWILFAIFLGCAACSLLPNCSCRDLCRCCDNDSRHRSHFSLSASHWSDPRGQVKQQEYAQQALLQLVKRIDRFECKQPLEVDPLTQQGLTLDEHEKWTAVRSLSRYQVR
jgi:hypothetical protein